MVIMPMGGVVIGVAGVICNSQCTGFGQYTTMVVLVRLPLICCVGSIPNYCAVQVELSRVRFVTVQP